MRRSATVRKTCTRLSLRKLRDVGGRHVLDHLHVAGQERRDARGVLRQQAQRHLLPRRLAAPVRVVARELDAIALRVAHELVGPGADRRLAGVEIVGGRLRRGLRDDRDLRHVGGHQRIGRRGLEPDRQRIDDDHLLDLLRVGGERRRAVRHRRHALDRGDDVGRGEVAAVVELDALAQLELPRQRVDRLPFGREPRLELRLLVALHEVAEDVGGDVVVRREVVIVRIDGGDVGAEADGQIRGRGRERRRRRTAAAAMARAVWMARAAIRWNRSMNPPVESLCRDRASIAQPRRPPQKRSAL